MNCNDREFLQLDRERQQAVTRRTFLQRSAAGLGLAAFGLLEAPRLVSSLAAQAGADPASRPYLLPRARAKRIIYLHQSGAPSQIDLFDHKPKLAELRGQELPPSVRGGQRLTGMTAGYDRLPLFPSPF